MDTTPMPGLVGALARVQPKNIDPAVWARYREDAAELIARLPLRDERDAIWRQSHLSAFVADVSRLEPGSPLSVLLHPQKVHAHLGRALAATTKTGNIENRRGTLNKLVALNMGEPIRTTRRSPEETHKAPYPRPLLETGLLIANQRPTRGAVDFARAVVAGMSGTALPTARRKTPLTLDRRDDVVLVDGAPGWQPPHWSAESLCGEITSSSMARARNWADAHLGVALDVRRLRLTWLDSLAGRISAVELLTLPGVGRDAAVSVARAAERPDAETVASLLREVR